MRYRQLGRWGMKVSEIALGAWVTYGDTVHDKEVIAEIVKIAYDGGVNFFDNADIYAMGKAEEIMGEILADYPRHTLVLSTKVYWPMSKEVNDHGLSRKHVRESITKSLRRLNTDYVDLYFAHRYDQTVPMEEIVTSFSGLVDEGKILYWGTSEWPAARLAEANTFATANGLHPPVVEQPQYSMLYRERFEDRILREAKRFGMGVVVWSPLAMGMLTGKYDDGLPAGSRLTDDEAMREFFARTQASPDPQYREYQRRVTTFNCQLAAQLHNAADAAQREHLRQRLAAWEEDFRALAKQAAAASQ